MHFPITVVLEDVRSALNVGAMFRTCDAAGVSEMVLGGITAYPPHNKIPKTALGATESVNWVHKKSLSDMREYITSKSQPLIALEITNDAKTYTDLAFPVSVSLIVGNEISGVSSETLALCDEVVKIPMYGIKESLNVATSLGIVLYEIIRQYTNDQSNNR